MPEDKPRKPSKPLPKRELTFNERIKHKFGLAWVQPEYVIKEVAYDEQEYLERIKLYAAGHLSINISATTVVFIVINRLLEAVNKHLYLMTQDIKAASFDLVRNFVNDYCGLDTMEIILFSAFETDPN